MRDVRAGMIIAKQVAMQRKARVICMNMNESMDDGLCILTMRTISLRVHIVAPANAEAYARRRNRQGNIYWSLRCTLGQGPSEVIAIQFT